LIIGSDWHEETIARTHDRSGFDCGDVALNDYLVRHARQNDARAISKTFVCIGNNDAAKILGYYTLSPASVEAERVPEAARRRSGNYDVSGFRLARLAIDLSAQGQGLGGQLLFSATRRCIRVVGDVGGTALFIDAKNDRARDWYCRYGASSLIDSPLSLILPLALVSENLRDAKKA
jgi:GNAT superfamily N-acetyltransferase